MFSVFSANIKLNELEMKESEAIPDNEYGWEKLYAEQVDDVTCKVLSERLAQFLVDTRKETEYPEKAVKR